MNGRRPQNAQSSSSGSTPSARTNGIFLSNEDTTQSASNSDENAPKKQKTNDTGISSEQTFIESQSDPVPERRTTPAPSKQDHVLITDVALSAHYTQVLLGSLVAQPELYDDLSGVARIFFVFSDLSVRSSGRYRLKFQLFFLPNEQQRMATSPLQVVSDVFTVFSPKTFPGMKDSTELSKCLARQGAKIHIRYDGANRLSWY